MVIAEFQGAITHDWLHFKQESILVGCQPPACRPYVLHNDITVWTCPVDGGRVPVERGPTWISLNMPMSGGGRPKGPCTGGGAGTGSLYKAVVPVWWGPMHHGWWSHDILCGQPDRHDWKYYLLASSLPGGNNCNLSFRSCLVNWTCRKWYSNVTLTILPQVKGKSISCI